MDSITQQKFLNQLSECDYYWEYLGLNSTLSEAIRKILSKGQVNLQEEKPFLPSLDQSTSAIIEPLIEHFILEGTIAELENLKSQLPKGISEFFKLKKLPAAKARQIYEALDIASLGELEYACNENRIQRIPGFDQQTQALILKNIHDLKRFDTSFLLSEALQEASELQIFLKTIPDVSRVEIVGSLRRVMETVHNINFQVLASNSEYLFDQFLKNPKVESVIERQADYLAVFLKNGMPCDLRVVSADKFESTLVLNSGSAKFNELLQTRAASMGYDLSHYYLSKNSQVVPLKSEQQLFQILNMKFVEPELREDSEIFKLAIEGSLPQLIVRENIRGIFHCHSQTSDGKNTLEEMIFAAEKMGFEYIGVSEHSLTIFKEANGLSKSRVLDQFKQIESLQKKVKIKILKGIESDILEDGNLAYEDSFLKKFDFVIGSIHARYNMKKSAMTTRLLKALKNPFIDFLGHPTNRLLLAREGVSLDMHKILSTAAQHRVIVELNSNPQRLDLDWRFGPYLKNQGGMISINPDAHSVETLSDIQYGILMARKAHMGKDNVINTKPLDEVLQYFKRNQK